MLLMEQMLIFSILILLGVYARKKQVINPSNIPALTQLVFNYAMPVIILTGVLGTKSRIGGTQLVHQNTESYDWSDKKRILPKMLCINNLTISIFRRTGRFSVTVKMASWVSRGKL